MRPILWLAVIVGCGLALAVPWYLNSGQRVVLYCAQDQEFAVGILERFRAETGLRVGAKYDTEADKSVSLYLELVKEAHPAALRRVLEQRNPVHDPAAAPGTAPALCQPRRRQAQTFPSCRRLPRP